jgi:hypothetical protein
MSKPLMMFHANFKRMSGPKISGETTIDFDVPELFENEIEGIFRLLKNRNLFIIIYDVEEIDQQHSFQNTETEPTEDIPQ